MNSVLLAGATWLHLLATVTLIGLYIVTYFAVTPAASASTATVGVILDAYRRAKPMVLIGWAIFILTGVVMMLVNPAYAGIGQFNNAWSILMLVKHVVVLGMILLSGMVNACPAIGMMRPLETALTRQDEGQIRAALGKLRSREMVTMLLGVLVLLLTAIAENV